MNRRRASFRDFVGVHEFERDIARALRQAEEDYALSRLLWYLNSGGRRRYEVICRPDKSERNLPRPDYVCRDRVSGAYVTVEVTRIFHHPQSRMIEQHRTAIWYKLAKRVGDKLPGVYGLTTPIRVMTKGLSQDQVAERLAVAVLAVAPDMGVGETKPLEFGVYLLKLCDGESALLPAFPDEEDHEAEEDPLILMNFHQIVRAIATPLREANAKLASFAMGTRVVLLDSQFWMERWDAESAAAQLDRTVYPNIDSLYVLNVEYRGRVLRLW